LLLEGLSVSLDLFETAAPDMLEFERRARKTGYRTVAGIDEAGRGPLAGPVVAAAVVLPEGVQLPGVTDSKKLTALRREELYPLIRERALAVAVGISDRETIDAINILQATLAAMCQAVESLPVVPDFLLVDGISFVPMPLPQKPLKKGDSRSLSIAAASIIAKVTRDRIMVEYDRQFPGYGFAAHKGYGGAGAVSHPPHHVPWGQGASAP
jgi:ribonuclease HII